jgi:hypothetical protein
LHKGIRFDPIKRGRWSSQVGEANAHGHNINKPLPRLYKVNMPLPRAYEINMPLPRPFFT